MNALFLTSILAFVCSAYSNADESTHLVTMRKAELMEIVDCISKAKYPVLCEKFIKCEMLMPKQVILAYEKCQKKCMTGPVKQCHFTSSKIPSMIFDCIAASTHKLNPEEKMKMVEFEKCSRELYAESCKDPKYYY